MKNWRESNMIVPLEGGQRGEGKDAGQVGLADFPAGTYPACSNHGALLNVGNGKWRCITGIADCNVGATWIKDRKCPHGHVVGLATISVAKDTWFCPVCAIYYPPTVLTPPAEWGPDAGRPSEQP